MATKHSTAVLTEAWAKAAAEHLEECRSVVTSVHGSLGAIQDGEDPHTSIAQLCQVALLPAMNHLERLVDELEAVAGIPEGETA